MLAPLTVVLGLLPAFALEGVFHSRLALTKAIIPAFGIQRCGQVARHILVKVIERARGLAATAAAGLGTDNLRPVAVRGCSDSRRAPARRTGKLHAVLSQMLLESPA